MNGKRLAQTMQVIVALVMVLVVAAQYGAGASATPSRSSPTTRPRETLPVLPAPPRPIVAPDALPSVSGTFDVGGYALFIACVGSGRPTVVLDAGLGWASDEWDAIMPDLAAITRVCAYDRASLGKSEASPWLRTAEQMADELHVLLLAAQIDGPYVLAGHGPGADNVRIYAAKWPGDVAALVLLGAELPDYAERQTALLPSTLAVYPGDFSKMLAWLKLPDASLWSENLDVAISAAQVRDSSLPASALLRVVAQPPVSNTALAFEEPQSHDVNTALRTQWYAMQRELAALSGNSLLLIASSSGHDLPIEEPDLVASVIAETVWAARAMERTGR